MQLSKIEIAKRQLDAASQLYFSGGDYLAVITLAGAAEEILGALLKRQGQRAMVDQLVDLDVALTGGRPFKTVSQEINRARNALKHAHDPSEDSLIVEPGEALAMLGRAIVNYVWLTKSATPDMVRAYDHLAELHPDVAR